MTARHWAARHWAARIATGAGLVGLVAGAATTVGRSLPRLPGLAPDTWVEVTSFSDFGVLAYAVGLVGLLLALGLRFRPLRLVLVFLTAALAAVHLSWIVPDFVSDGDRSRGETSVRVLSQNMRLGLADPASLLRNAEGADVLVLTELTAPTAKTLEDHGVRQQFSYQASGPLPASGSAGTRIYSRFPLADARPLDASIGAYDWMATVQVPQLGPVTVVACHPTRPRRGGTGWAPDQQLIRRLAPRHQAMLVGDFNAVDSHPSLRALGRDGFRDSDGIFGAGWTPTYSAQGRLPPLVGIDHVLLSPDLTATSYQRVRTASSDHLGVLATVTLRG